MLDQYQLDAISFVYGEPYSALWLDMGLGKTVIMLTLIKRLIDEWLDCPILVIAPKRVAIQTWPTEIGEWEHTKTLPFTLIRPTGREPEVVEARQTVDWAARTVGFDSAAKQRLMGRTVTQAEELVRQRLARSTTPLHIINRERLPWLVRFWRQRGRWPYRTMIWDEASGLRRHTSERFKAMAFVRSEINRLHELTGTPAPETYIDLFSQIYLLDRGKRFGKAITPFREQYFHYTPESYKWTIKNGSAQQMEQKIADIVLVMREDEHLDTTKPRLIDRPVTLDPDEYEQYKELEDNFILELPEASISVDTAGALAQKLLQYASGAVYDENKRPFHIHNKKIEELEEIVEEAQGASLLVAYGFQSSLQRLKKAFPKAVVMDAEGRQQHPWNRGEIDMMLIHPASAGHGLNLQQGGHNLVFFDVPYSLELYLQTIARLFRRGQPHLVKVFHIWARDTVDQDIVPRLKRKESAQDTLMRRVKEIRNARKTA